MINAELSHKEYDIIICVLEEKSELLNEQIKQCKDKIIKGKLKEHKDNIQHTLSVIFKNSHILMKAEGINHEEYKKSELKEYLKEKLTNGTFEATNVTVQESAYTGMHLKCDNVKKCNK